MSGAPSAVRARLSRLLVEVEVERDAMERFFVELEAHAGGLDGSAERPLRALIAVDLHGYYTAAETLFERIARIVDGEVPSGADSHRELVEQMAAEIPPLRPAVISASTRAWLHGLRGFRHFFRHAYVVELDWRRLQDHANAVLAHHAALCQELTSFFAFVVQTRDALPSS